MVPAQNLSRAGTILVVEDDDDTRDALCQLLCGQGYQVAQVANGREALDYLARATAQLIITDLSMPVMSGWQLVDRLRADPELRKVPLMVLSADEPPPIEGLCFVRKPAPAEKLLQLIGRTILAGSAGSARARIPFARERGATKGG